MFADSLLQSPWADRSRRGWTTAVSFFLQAAVLGGFLLLPLLYTQGLPQLQFMAALVAPAPLPAPPAPAQVRNPHQITSNLSSQGYVIVPRSIPAEILPVNETSLPPSLDIAGAVGPGGTGEKGIPNGVLNSVGTGLNAIIPPPPVAVAHPLRPSVMMEGNLMHRIDPQYPVLARQARVQGVVILRAMITREGKIANLQVVSGSPLLVQSALDAVRQWTYRPYYLNNEPVEVETQVIVNFTLSGGS